YEVSLLAPVTLAQGGAGGTVGGMTFAEPGATALGDLSLGGSAWLLGDGATGGQLGLAAALVLPVGSTRAFAGDDGIGGRAHVLGAWRFESVCVGVDAALVARPERTYADATIGSEASIRAGVQVPV